MDMDKYKPPCVDHLYTCFLFACSLLPKTRMRQAVINKNIIGHTKPQTDVLCSSEAFIIVPNIFILFHQNNSTNFSKREARGQAQPATVTVTGVGGIWVR